VSKFTIELFLLAKYRREMVKVLVRKVIREMIKGGS